MDLDWSEQSPHIRTLYRPWQVGDGYDEAAIAAAEAQIGTRLPTTLRSYCYADTLNWDGEELVLGPWQPSHPHVSAFLDDLTYKHAFCGSAVHGGCTGEVNLEPRYIEWLEHHWRHGVVTPLFRGQYPDTPEEGLLGSPLYIRDGQALGWCCGFAAVAREAEALDEIGEALGVTWEERW